MDKQQLLSGRVSDLSRQCWNGDYLTHTNFLSASELADFFSNDRASAFSWSFHI
ncbi:hypothetical protein [Baileyella intestinalis]|uniref:hypothetical protein n=1 Tax=Baileyella intestinalis TaxID=2606709 RepID=UPI0022E98ED7|nr:hypothetical protein [Baileyella intestinalis]